MEGVENFDLKRSAIGMQPAWKVSPLNRSCVVVVAEELVAG